MKKTGTVSIKVILAAVLLLSWLPLAPASAAPTDLFFTEYIEGSSFNKALEIYNGTGAAVDLALGLYSVQLYSNGVPSPSQSANLTGTIADGDVFVLAHPTADPIILAQANFTSSALVNFNGNDAVTLSKNGVIIDVIGQIGYAPTTEWGSGLTSTAENTLRRKYTVCMGDTDGTNAFDPSIEWNGYAQDTFGGLGAHFVSCGAEDTAPSVSATTPIQNASDFPAGNDLKVTFSEPVNVTSSWFTLVCTVSGTVSAVVSGGPTTFTLNPGVNLTSGESCNLTIVAAQVSDQDILDPPDTMAADYLLSFTPMDYCSTTTTPIYSIQGSGASAAITGAVTTKGIVVCDEEGPSPALRGFYLQDTDGDGNAATSDGIFVFNGDNNQVNNGDLVVVSGSAEDFSGQTQIGSVTLIALCGTDTVDPVDVNLPLTSMDTLEPYEGMLVRFPQTLFVTEHFQLGRFGQVVMSSGARLQQPTNIALPGAPALALQAANNLNRIIVDDPLNNQNSDPILFGRNGSPLTAANTLRGGDTVTNMVGVMTYTWGGSSSSPNAYRLRPVNALGGGVPNFVEANSRPSAAPAVGGTLKVASFNVLNFYNTFTGCTAGVGGTSVPCRGAYDQVELDRQVAKTVPALLKVDADVIGISEIENDGYAADSAIQYLVDQLNAVAGTGTYAFIDADTGTGQVNALGIDAIKVGLLYKPASVTPIGATAALNSVAFVNGGDAAIRNRPSLAQAFIQTSTGGRFVVDVNHLKSKGSACDTPDAGDGQSNCSGVRTNAANVLAAWLAGDPTGVKDSDVLILGDLNSYAKEDPIAALETAGFTNLIGAYSGTAAYSYAFDGQWGYLDHALSNGSLTAQVAGAAEYHINADEPSVLDYNTENKSSGQIVSLFSPDEFRTSDHDVVIIGLDLDPTILCWFPIIANQ